jgi:hypothetical protein
MFRKLFFMLCAGSFIAACSTPSVVTAWKLPQADPKHIQNILIVGIIQEDSPFARIMIENYFSAELKKSGYQAPTAVATFGAKGLANLPREETLVRLCNNGIDAVLTITLVDGGKEPFKSSPRIGQYPANFYLDRIWNYKDIEADIRNARDPGALGNFWEIILFDLYTLQPLCALQTKSFSIDKHGPVSPELAKRIVAKLVKQKLIRKRNDQNLQKKNGQVIAVNQPAT